MTHPTLSGKTTLVGLIGWPVGHSRSPVMHNAAFAALGLDWCYVPLPVNPEPAGRVGEAVRGLRALGLAGANVTVPHKQAVIACCDEVTPAEAGGGIGEDGRVLATLLDRDPIIDGIGEEGAEQDDGA